MKTTSEDGELYCFESFEVIHNDPGSDLWEDITTQFFLCIKKITAPVILLRKE